MDKYANVGESNLSVDHASCEESETSSQVISGGGFRKKLSDLKDWKFVLSRTRKSYEAVQEDALKQVLKANYFL